jgi:hypothetical protein
MGMKKGQMVFEKNEEMRRESRGMEGKKQNERN